jgi:hypothetical protein
MHWQKSHHEADDAYKNGNGLCGKIQDSTKSRTSENPMMLFWINFGFFISTATFYATHRTDSD